MSKGIRMSLADAQEHQRKNGFLTDTMRSVETPGAASKPIRGSRQPNKTEAEFGRILEARKRAGELDSATFEGAKLRIAGNCYYTPDYMTVRQPGADPMVQMVTFFEVKGAHIWDDSKVKFRAAKELHSWAAFEMWQKKGGSWARVL